MRLQCLIPISLACLAVSQNPRTALVTDCLNSVTNGVVALSSAENKLTAENVSKDGSALQGLVQKVVANLKDCAAKFNDFSKTGKFNLLEAMGMQSSGSKLGEATKKGVDTIIGKKDIIVKAGMQGTIKNQLNDILAATTAFNNALLGTLPDVAKTQAEPSVKEPVADIQKAIQAYS